MTVEARSNRDLLCVALDGSDRVWISEMARNLAGEVGWLKIGLEAFTAFGPGLVDEVAGLGPKVFLDLKLQDIPNTVARAVGNCAGRGVSLLTVHAGGGRAMLEAAAKGAERNLKVVAVTVLTSLDPGSLEEVGFALPPTELALRGASLAKDCGLNGVVSSAHEAEAIRRACGPDFFIVTPGIRPPGAETDDQRRVVTPAEAKACGADLLVVGRPVTTAPDPVAAARAILADLE